MSRLTPPHNIKSRNPGASVGACNVIWLDSNLVSIDKAVLLEACKGDGDQTVSESRIAVRDYPNYYFFSVGGEFTT